MPKRNLDPHPQSIRSPKWGRNQGGTTIEIEPSFVETRDGKRGVVPCPAIPRSLPVPHFSAIRRIFI
jgi:hypothetical protein